MRNRLRTLTGRTLTGRTLTGRTVLVTCATAVVAVLVTALVAFPAAVRAANNEARAGLEEKADLAVEVLEETRPAQRRRTVDRLQEQNIAVYLVRRGAADRAGLPVDVVADVARGLPVTRRAAVDGRAVLLVARPLPGNGAGVVLTRPAVTGAAGPVLGTLGWALLAGLFAGAVAGSALARLSVRPIRAAAAAATALAEGDRTVRVQVAPPAEAADLATALNGLAAALATSENREREFLLSVSHDLRTPLATLRGYAEALADGVVGPDGSAAVGSTMLAEAQRLDRLVADLLVLARLEAVDLPLDVGAVDLAELVSAAGRAWGARCADAGVDLRVERPDAAVTVTTDPGRVRQVVDNLGENALRLAPPGAPLVLAARATPDGGVVEVRDGGPGLSDDDLAVAFVRGALHERYRGQRAVGTGVGLALAARLVRRLGGTIEAGHAPEGGARFTVTLPYQTRTPS